MRQTAPNIKYARLRSDNAGCYHEVEALLSVEQLFKETGVWIKTIGRVLVTEWQQLSNVQFVLSSMRKSDKTK